MVSPATAATAALYAARFLFRWADAHTFRNLVQKLTGATDDTVEKLPVNVLAHYSARSPNCAGSGHVGGRGDQCSSCTSAVTECGSSRSIPASRRCEAGFYCRDLLRSLAR
ncbi:hypothetical protein AAC387_Pa05g3207 [Persea americana]